MKKLVVLDRDEQKRLIRRRRAMGGDRFDEVWNDVYIMSPDVDNEHQRAATKLAGVLDRALGEREDIQVFAGTNVSDRSERWKKNYRCPDVAVFLPGNPAQDRGTHWLGGPDFAVEIISPNDRSRKKFEFYAQVGVRELLLVARKPWRLELCRRHETEWAFVGKSDLEQPNVLASEVLALSFRLVEGPRRPRIEVTSADGAHRFHA
ncbi:MAG: Uma2 family endonuclease [Isosphaeraceae bacterium]|nr:Uma2 family endonuclease [Isosphaeraceae bacterium]